VILILASSRDRVARRLAARWAGAGAVVVTCRDLCRPGWQLGDGGAETLAVDGAVIDASRLTGVLVRLAGVQPDELRHVGADDREYAAAELTAVLLAWLTALDVPVLNRPTATCLSGPGWRPEQWTRAAAQIGIGVRPVRRRVPATEPVTRDLEVATVTVAGRRCIGGDPAMRACARALARHAGAQLVDLHFAVGAPETTFTSANPWPDLLRPGVCEATRAALAARSLDRAA
jgi:hypothetical protein